MFKKIRRWFIPVHLKYKCEIDWGYKQIHTYQRDESGGTLIGYWKATRKLKKQFKSLRPSFFTKSKIKSVKLFVYAYKGDSKKSISSLKDFYWREEKVWEGMELKHNKSTIWHDITNLTLRGKV